MLIEDYDIELSTPECDLESPIFRASVSLDADISEVLPYVNATVQKAEFIPSIPVLVWTEDSHKYALRSREIAISNIADREQAKDIVEAIVERINAIWEKESRIGEVVEVPASLFVSGHVYRVRARWQDATRRWSRWSNPVQIAKESKF